mgnify:CR=1 FL=1
MNLNATLIAQFVVFFILAGFTMKFVWPPLMNALDERAKNCLLYTSPSPRD